MATIPKGTILVADITGIDADVDAISKKMILVAVVAPMLTNDVNFGGVPIFFLSSAVLFLCAPLKTLRLFSAGSVIHLKIYILNI